MCMLAFDGCMHAQTLPFSRRASYDDSSCPGYIRFPFARCMLLHALLIPPRSSQNRRNGLR